MESFRQVLPAPGLRDCIAFYSGYQQRGVPPRTHRGLPSPYLTLIVTFDEPLVIARHVDPRRTPGAYDTLIGGLHTTPAIITHGGSQSGVQLAVHPHGARSLFGLPAGELSGIDFELGELCAPLARELQQRVQAASSWSQRFDAIDQVLLRAMDPARAPSPEVLQAWRILRSDAGTSTAALARRVGWSERHLRSRFVTEIGLTPKAASRVFRFDLARRDLQRRGASGTFSLADLAPAHGYYDQAHLAREFRALAGCSPTRWLAEEFRNVQASRP